MQAEVITVGSELMLGVTLNTHSQFISRACVPIGVEVAYHTSVGDHADRLAEVIKVAHSRSQLVFLCGGLGPTLDDLTKETLADMLGETLVEDLQWRQRLERHFSKRNTPIPTNNYKQALVFSSGIVFPNEKGTAPGLSITKDGVIYILLPGPPGELKPMFEQQVLPFLHRILPSKEVIYSHPMSFLGIGESALEEELKDLIITSDNPILATYAMDIGVTLRITSHAESEDLAKQLIEPIRNEILSRVGKHCYSESEESLEELVIHHLRNNKQSVATAESCTGGLVVHLLTTVPGASEEVKGGFVSYSNKAKTDIVGVSTQVLKEFGAVSMKAAEQLAEQTRQRFQTDFAISVTGVAGPASSESKPVGLVYIGLAQIGMPTAVLELSLTGDRERIQKSAAKHALFFLLERLKKGETTI
ncbi:competence/damage-inducible protein A [Shimazuella sp. AN120528]|uniref:competence/damage-inducible protein A n=1 Tax=Shimazuella soli TaxID=1892854 RepID=UPI001F0F5D71|nr:competence/damage-inducible protein A [Shimazuella soli]MCH5586427.1 competence/damage-inducible protein A [Shimazuella soli]